ncbi:MAG: bifunctional proline dehydrogenase/L-glutamate gamma-semialdehyde dehydrogenase PutA, partial [Gammaproteobacteria bacterium]|nr:bifunctional proline dehydrogenase/L-glutamate gamma-semialdehyde dehydrogenase PutA [Gammaproteobacteria bacterium]
ARSAGMGFNIDAEEADRLDLSLDVIEAVLSDPVLAGWDGFGVVVQTYGPRAPFVLDWLYALTHKLDRRIMIRLVKGAYWDAEIKLAQVNGLDGFPVFTRKASTDVCYISCAHKLLKMTDRIYPQFATHNAHTVAAILQMATNKDDFEFQRLHGMSESLYDIMLKQENTRCRIYAPVGAHRDLLAYLVRRLLENGANSSFVNQIVDEDVPAEIVASDPFAVVDTFNGVYNNPAIKLPIALYGEHRINSKGYDLSNPKVLAAIEEGRRQFRKTRWQAAPLTVTGFPAGTAKPVENPFDAKDSPGSVVEATARNVVTAISDATIWNASPQTRAEVLRRASDLYEEHAFELYALATREAGKTLLDAIGEVREAIDFLRYYAAEISHLENAACGLFACISPWNFPLAIFTGQIAAALAAGNGVLAKPAETTPLIACRAVQLLHEAGVPRSVLQCLPGQGEIVGSALTQDARISGVCFTGSTLTAQHINRSMAQNLLPHAPLIAETGGLNAMIVDSSSLPEQAVRDIIASAFQSAGQRCSALRLLYVQEDIANTIKDMLFGAMDELQLGDPWDVATDIGPVIDEAAREKIETYINNARNHRMLLKQLDIPDHGNFVGPSVIRVSGIADLPEEIFGPVLHIATFKAKDIIQVVQDINASGYGLTFGLHTRIDERVQKVVEQLKAGNIYVNRNQVGAVVGSQPFGGEGLSGTGPKAGGPNYLRRFTRGDLHQTTDSNARALTFDEVQALINSAQPANETLTRETIDLPGPTGESNRLSTYPRGTVLCCGPDSASL